MKTKTEITEVTDATGNVATIACWGSEKAARAALASLTNCKNCTDCSDCSRCSGCLRCSDCSDCTGCTDCSRCSDCSDCSRCFKKKGDAGSFSPPPIPKIENIHAKVLEAVSQPDALDMDRWHSCGTKHCRGGWVVHLAGDAGYALERFHNTLLAAQLIYRESAPTLPVSPVRFFDNEADATADMERFAKLEAEVA